MSEKNTGENRSEKARETTKKRRPEGDRKMDQSPRSPAPWSPATLEIRVAGFPPKVSFFRSFSRFAMFGPCDFLKIWFLRHNIRRSSSTSRIRHQNHLIIIGHSKIANRPTKKAHFLPDRLWNRHPTSNNMRIHRWSLQEEFQKTRRGPRLFKRLGGQLMKLNDLFMTTY